MLLTPGRAEERIWHLVYETGPLRGTAADVADEIGCDIEDTRHALDKLVARNGLRRHDVPGMGQIYWS